ncbi:MAG: DUF2062 domain-containing protein [Mariprofundaceae bacterium]|nr:DUF2062 domain-containing protein [Mariprofundaceae bacterium]
MPRKFAQRWMPNHKTIREHKALRCFGRLLHDPCLWHLNRHSLAKACFIGLFCAFLPIPFQMVVAAAGAIWLRANLPVSVALVWLTNPLTMPPLFYLAYKVGGWILLLPEKDFHFEASFDWAIHSMLSIWQPFLLGCLVLGLLSGILGYIAIHWSWRAAVMRRWKKRHKS